MALQQLILLRHGETSWNAGRRLQGHRDIELSDIGVAQVAAAAASVAAMEPDVVISSDLRRTMATARPIAELLRIPLRADPRLRETRMGRWEGLTRDEVIARWPEEWSQWRTTGAEFAPPGGESRVQVAARSSALVDELDAEETECALLVTHGGLIVGLTGYLLGWPQREWSRLEGIGNCHWVVLHRLATWRLHTYNGGLGGLVLPASADDVVDD